MIEHQGVLIHLDPKGDWIENGNFEFDGWIAATADRLVKGVSLPEAGTRCLTTCKRPDVERVFPGRVALGFSGKISPCYIKDNKLRVAFQVGDEVFQVEYPLPAPLPTRSLRERIVSAVELGWLALRKRWSTNRTKRWELTLQQHLVYRRQRSGVFRRLHTDALLKDFAAVVPDAVFIQIGANDGVTGDPINHLITRADTQWNGVLVEPVAHLFSELSKRYAHDPRLRLERAAIGESDGTAMIHRLQTTAKDSLWLEQVPSLELDVLRRAAQQLAAADKVIVQEQVRCLTVATLLARHRIERLDLLVIDTEGSDWRILRQFDLTLLQPKLILYEHQHLSLQERAEAHQFLARHQYDWAETPEGDTIAWKTRSLAAPVH